MKPKPSYPIRPKRLGSAKIKKHKQFASKLLSKLLSDNSNLFQKKHPSVLS